jgi:TolB protein
MLVEAKSVSSKAALRRGSGWRSAFAILAVLASGAVSAQQPLRVTITKGGERAVPIAIVPFGWQGTGAPAYDLAAVVTSDLRNSGRFAPIPVGNMVTRPTQPSQVNANDWRMLRVDALVIGQLSQSGPDMYTAQFQLFDVAKGEQLVGFRLDGSTSDLRGMGHKIADMVFEKLTGIPGVFSTRIAYVSEQRNSDGSRMFRLIVADADGENSSPIAESAQPLMSPAWAPDGRQLAYASFEGNAQSVYVQTLRSGTRNRVSSRQGVNSSPSFSPDGRMLTLTLSQNQDGNLDVYTLDLATQVLRQLTNGDAIDTEATWAPDGRTIYFTSDRAGGPQIYRVAAQPGGRAERVTFEGVYNARPRVSPDGKKIAVVYGQNNTYRIGVVEAANGQLQLLTDGRLDESPSFAPNGDQIIYATRDGNRGVLASVTVDGNVRTEIASVAGGDVREPVWGPYPRP